MRRLKDMWLSKQSGTAFSKRLCHLAEAFFICPKKESKS
ncbi:hypothetical protein B4129_0135 [Bacillus safensis]|nr:hypothetical protein B4129_0135 [Bacillus safensis]